MAARVKRVISLRFDLLQSNALRLLGFLETVCATYLMYPL